MKPTYEVVQLPGNKWGVIERMAGGTALWPRLVGTFDSPLYADWLIDGAKAYWEGHP